MDKNRKLNRLAGFDYSSEALYFVTSCTDNKIYHFGEISNGELSLNIYGKVAEKQWLWLGGQYQYLTLHSFIIMPNHMHGIIEIDTSKIAIKSKTLQKECLSNEIPKDPVKIKSISELMGAYKTTTSKHIHLAGLNEFKWQRSFHDHIIRDAKSFEKISNYIENNPDNWPEDSFYTKTNALM
jgi:putative transposase